MKNSKFALIFVFISAIGWGLTGVLVKLLAPVSPFALTYHRLLIALIVSAPMILFLYRKKRDKFIGLKNPFGWILASLLAGYYLSATIAFQLAPVAEVALLLTISPLFVLLIKLIINQKIHKNEYIGATLAFVGVIYILLPNLSFEFLSTKDHFLGNIFSILSAFLTASYATLYRSLHLKGSEPDTLIVSLITLIIGVLALSFLQEPDVSIINIGNIDWKNVEIYVLLGIFCTAIPTIGFAISSKKLPSVITASTSFLILIFTNVFSYIILKETISSDMLFGSFIVLSGLGIMLTKKNLI